MQIAPVDLTELVAVVLGVSIVLIPVIGLTARFALKPTMEALSRFFEKQGQDQVFAMLERRCQLLESQVEALESDLRRVKEGQDFERALGSGAPLSDTGGEPDPLV